jgi:tetratricopeptide (TPR) repeat protein
MIGQGWLTLKQAHEALRAGRLEEAQQLLAQPLLQGHRRCLELLRQLMRALLERANKHLRHDDTAQAWADLLRAEAIGITDSIMVRLRQALTRIGLAEVRALLDAGQPRRALESISHLHERLVQQTELNGLEQGAKEWVIANDHMDRGEFSRALQALERAAALLRSHGPALAQARRTLEQKQHDFTPLVEQVHAATQAERWPEVLRLSEKLLALAPHQAEVHRLRSRAWKALEPATVVQPHPAVPAPVPAEPPPKKRLILWIDGVGGYLLLLENTVTLGQAGPEVIADIPLLADVSRLHARLTRDTEGYVIDGLRPVAVNNLPVDKKLLRTGDRLTLGSSCQILFRQEVPISATARLDLVSGHRFGRGVDGVILMAETLVLGPDAAAHIPVPDLQQPIILYRNKEEIGIRSPEEITINGQPLRSRGVLEAGCTVVGSSFSLSVEQVELGGRGSDFGRRA